MPSSSSPGARRSWRAATGACQLPFECLPFCSYHLGTLGIARVGDVCNMRVLCRCQVADVAALQTLHAASGSSMSDWPAVGCRTFCRCNPSRLHLAQGLYEVLAGGLHPVEARGPPGEGRR